jgi:hypothetical protein
VEHWKCYISFSGSENVWEPLLYGGANLILFHRELNTESWVPERLTVLITLWDLKGIGKHKKKGEIEKQKGSHTLCNTNVCTSPSVASPRIQTEILPNSWGYSASRILWRSEAIFWSLWLLCASFIDIYDYKKKSNYCYVKVPAALVCDKSLLLMSRFDNTCTLVAQNSRNNAHLKSVPTFLLHKFVVINISSALFQLIVVIKSYSLRTNF